MITADDIDDSQATFAGDILETVPGLSLSRNGEITEQEWDMLTEKKKPVDDVRDFTLLREAQKELKIR